MGGIYKENYKRSNKKNSIGAADDSDLVRVEDLVSLAPVSDLSASGFIVGPLDLSASGFLTEAVDISASGFVVGPDGAEDANFVLFDGATGKLIQGAPYMSYDISNDTIHIDDELLVTDAATFTQLVTFNAKIIYPPTVVTAPFTASAAYITLVRSTVSSGNLPSAPMNGLVVAIKDADGVAGGSPITIDGNGNTIDGDAQATLTNNYESVTLVYSSTTGEWHVI